MLGALFAVLSALSFGFSSVAARRGVVGSSASYGLYITVIIGVPLFMVAAAATGQFLNTFDLSLEALGMLAAAGVLHFLIGRYCNYRCIDAIGANRSQPLQATNTLYSVVVAVLVLGERCHPAHVCGHSAAHGGPTGHDRAAASAPTGTGCRHCDPGPTPALESASRVRFHGASQRCNIAPLR